MSTSYDVEHTRVLERVKSQQVVSNIYQEMPVAIHVFLSSGNAIGGSSMGTHT